MPELDTGHLTKVRLDASKIPLTRAVALGFVEYLTAERRRLRSHLYERVLGYSMASAMYLYGYQLKLKHLHTYLIRSREPLMMSKAYAGRK